MTQHTAEDLAKARVLTIVLAVFTGVLFSFVLKSCTVINCQPRLKQVICKVDRGESDTLEILKTKLSRLKTKTKRELGSHKPTESTVLITNDDREIILSNAIDKVSFSKFINDRSATNLTLDYRPKLIGVSIIFVGGIFFVFKDAWIVPPKK